MLSGASMCSNMKELSGASIHSETGKSHTAIISRIPLTDGRAGVKSRNPAAPPFGQAKYDPKPGE